MLTLHGATPEQLKKLTEFCEREENDVTLAVAARETGEHGVHPHFQCYLELKDRCSLKKKFTELFEGNFHLEIARGTREANLNYVYAVNKPYEIGWIQYRKGDFQVPDRYSDYAMKFMENFRPRPFQQEILDIVRVPSFSNRTIYWFYEEKGNTGKSALATYLHRMYGAVRLTGRGSDMKHALMRIREIVNVDPPIVMIDVARSARVDHSLMVGIEEIRDGCFFSGKYESGMIDIKQPLHVVVIANRPPNPSWFSQDR